MFQLRRESTAPGSDDITRDDLVDLSADYEVGGVIGRGGMAEVYAATDRRTGEEVAIKRIQPMLAVHTRIRSRFANEVDLLRRCRGRFVLSLRDHGVWEDAPAYVAERCVGSLLDVGRAHPLALSQVLRYASEVLVALDVVHAVGGVHRDIKPSNVLVARDGGTRLADFGVALHPARRLTAMGHRIGTPAFTAADLVADPRLAEPAHDLYAVGLLVLTLSTHLKPRAITGAERPATLRRFPDATARLLDRATAHRPGDRFASAAEMAVAVEHALSEL